MASKHKPPPPSPVDSDENLGCSREDEIYKVVRNVLENSGELQKMKAQLQTKILQIVRGGDNSPIISHINKDPRIKILDALITEYFHWFGYQYTIEMYASESGTDPSCPRREILEKSVGKHQNDFPILVEVVHKLMEENKDTLVN